MIFQAKSFTKILDNGGQNGPLVITHQNIFQPPIGDLFVLKNCKYLNLFAREVPNARSAAYLFNISFGDFYP